MMIVPTKKGLHIIERYYRSIMRKPVKLWWWQWLSFFGLLRLMVPIGFHGLSFLKSDQCYCIYQFLTFAVTFCSDQVVVVRIEEGSSGFLCSPSGLRGVVFSFLFPPSSSQPQKGCHVFFWIPLLSTRITRGHRWVVLTTPATASWLYLTYSSVAQAAQISFNTKKLIYHLLWNFGAFHCFGRGDLPGI